MEQRAADLGPFFRKPARIPRSLAPRDLLGGVLGSAPKPMEQAEIEARRAGLRTDPVGVNVFELCYE